MPERATAFVEDAGFDPYNIGKIMVEMSKIWEKYNLPVIMNETYNESVSGKGFKGT